MLPWRAHKPRCRVRPGTASAFLNTLDFARPIADYDQTVRKVQKAIGKAPAEAFSTPAAAARASGEMIDNDQLRLRFAVGIQAENDMRAALADRLQDLAGPNSPAPPIPDRALTYGQAVRDARTTRSDVPD